MKRETVTYDGYIADNFARKNLHVLRGILAYIHRVCLYINSLFIQQLYPETNNGMPNLRACRFFNLSFY